MNLARIQDFKRPALFFSGGLDSTLLLAILRENNVVIDIVTVGREHWTKQQKQRMDTLIRDWELKIFAYPPSGISFMGDGENITAVFDYAIGGMTVPLLRDVIGGDKCVAELDGLRLHESPINWDCVVVGSRKFDKHYALDTIAPDKEWNVGRATFLAPLYEYTREEVQEQLRMRGLPWEEVDDDEDTGNLNVCDLCLSAIEGQVFCPKEEDYIPAMGSNLRPNLKMFRERMIH